MSKDPEKRKRKKKLEEKKRKARETKSEVYLGEKYKKEKFIPLWVSTETAIYQSYVMTERKLIDPEVRAAIIALIGKLRAKAVEFAPASLRPQPIYGHEELVLETIRTAWVTHFVGDWRPSNEDLIGVLRSILGSMQKMRFTDVHSQGYLGHIASFLTKQLGISVQQIPAPPNFRRLPAEDELLRLGRAWSADGNREARAEFFELADDLIQSGRSDRLAAACTSLIDELDQPDAEPVAELKSLRDRALAAAGTASG